MITYAEARQRSHKPRDIWVRRFVCDPITTPVAYALAHTKIQPMHVTLATFVLGMGAMTAFVLGNLPTGALLYLMCFLSDSTDGKLMRVLGRDDTYRGIIDFILDGIVCIAVAVGIAVNGNMVLVLLLLVWMSIHYYDMRMTSATYRIKVQLGDGDVWLINRKNEGNLLKLYGRFVERFKTYPHPTVGEAVVLMFIAGPLAWWATGNIGWMYAVTVLGILFIIPETVGAMIIAYKLAVKGDSSGPGK